MKNHRQDNSLRQDPSEADRSESRAGEGARTEAGGRNPGQHTSTRLATGPRTAKGKAVSSRNAIKHGFLSKTVVIQTSPWSENMREYRSLLRSHMAHYEPRGPGETSLVELAVITLWRYRRFLRAEGASILAHRSMFDRDEEPVCHQAAMEDRFLPAQVRERAKTRYREHLEHLEEINCRAAIPHPLEIERLQRYEAHLLRIYFRSLNELERLQRLRLGHPVPAPIAIDVQS